MKWFFLNQKSEVVGPLEKWEVELQLVSEPEGLIWGSGVLDWLSSKEWRDRVRLLEEVLADLEGDKQKIWHFQEGSEIYGPFIYHDLIEELKKCSDSSRVLIRRSPNKKMRPIYEWPILVEESGLSRRKHVRAPIQAQFDYVFENQKYQKKLNSISEGGFSLLNCFEHNEDDRFKGQITSSFLGRLLQCEARLIHKHKSGICSFAFVSLEAEALISIKKYTDQFKMK